MVPPKFVQRFSAGIGFNALISSSRNLKLLIFLRMVRLFGCGGATLILALYLSALGISDSKIGLFMTLTLVGNMVISIVLTYIGNSMGVRITIAFGSLLMTASGFAFAFLDNYWLLLLASIAGVINPSANEVDPFKAIEEAAIAHLSTPEDCSDIFAWWSMLGMFGTAASTLLTGFAVERLQELAGLAILEAYRIIFLAYACVGIVKLLLTLCLSSQIEFYPIPLEESDSTTTPEDTRQLLADEETASYGAISGDRCTESSGPSSLSLEKQAAMFSPESFSFLLKLCLAMALDFIGSGLAQISWMTYFFKRQYHVRESQLGLAIFIASLASSVLNLASSPLARAIGQVPTMVICHTVNSISLLMISVPNKTLALMLLIFRIVTRELENAPRQASISAGVVDGERASAMGMINVVKTVGSCVGLFLTGKFADLGHFSLAVIIAGCLKLGYNVVIAAFFWNNNGRRLPA